MKCNGVKCREAKGGRTVEEVKREDKTDRKESETKRTRNDRTENMKNKENKKVSHSEEVSSRRGHLTGAAGREMSRCRCASRRRW